MDRIGAAISSLPRLGDQRGRHLFRALAALFLGLFSGPAAALTFQIDGVAFDDSAYLDDAALQAVAAEYVRRPIGFDDLQSLVADVQQLYSAAGVLTARAVLPPQEISDGILRIALVEASIDRVDYSGLPETSPEFLRRNIALSPGQQPDFERLERDLQIFDIAHDLRPTLRFEAGETTGTATAYVEGTEPKRYQWILSADNFGREETGEERLSLFGRWSSVTGWRDTMSLQLQVSDGAYSGSLGYSRPIGPQGGRIVASAGMSNSSVIQGQFEPIDIVSDSVTATVGYRWPHRVTPGSHWVFEAGLAYDSTSSELSGLKLADMSLVEAYGTANWSRRRDNSLLNATVGLRIGDADAEQVSQTEGSYYLLFGSAGYSRPLGKRMVFDATAQFQYAEGQNLPVARLFSAGGVGTVRGYTNNIRSGDSGLIVRLQGHARNPWRPESLPSLALRPFGFADVAVVVPYRTSGGVESDDILASVGAGLQVQYNDKATLMLLTAMPLRDTLGFDDKGKAQVYVGLDYPF